MPSNRYPSRGPPIVNDQNIQAEDIETKSIGIQATGVSLLGKQNSIGVGSLCIDQSNLQQTIQLQD